MRTWYFLPLLLLCAIYTWKSTFAPIGDFGNYYYAGQFLQQGIFDSNIYFPEYFNTKIFDLNQQYSFLSFAPNSPFIALLFAPLSFFSVPIAKLVFSLFSVFLFLYSLVQLNKSYPLSKWTIALLPILIFVPLKNQILFGQLYFVLFFLLTMGFLAYKKERWTFLSIWWGLAIMLKIFPVILILFLLLNGKIKGLVYLIISSTILLFITLPFTGWHPWVYLLTEVLPRANAGEIAGEYVDHYQSVFMFLKRLLVFHPVENNSIGFNAPFLFKPIILAFKLMGIATLSFLTWKEKNNLITFSLWLILSLLLTAYGSTYSFLLFLPFVWAVPQLRIPFNAQSALLLLLGIAFNSSLFPLMHFPFQYLRMFIFMALFVGIILRYRNSIPLKKIAFAVTLGSFVCIPFFKITTNEPYATSFSMPILTYNYRIKNNLLTYFYWNKNGPQKETISYPITSVSTSGIEIIENQILYNNQPLTNSSSTKKEARLINGHHILYLSDAGRGIGFYQLRIIDIEK